MPVASQIDAEHAWSSPLGFLSHNNFLGVGINAGTSASTAVQLPGTGNSVVLTNPVENSVTVYFALGASNVQAVAASSASFPVLPGVQTTISRPADNSDMWVSAITRSGTAFVTAHLGSGV